MQAKRALLIAILLVLVVAAAFIGSQIWTGFNGGNGFRNEAIVGTEYINVSTYRLNVTGPVRNETVYAYEEVVDSHAHYERVVTLNCVEGWEATALWEGVLVKDLLKR
jgi:DMSO/TMAO reductase YedYZ molybdopterin-dependent catalytic subunit